MATMFVRHNVSDYATWRKAYDDFAPGQKAGGVTREAVYQSPDDPNDLTVLHEFATLQEAQAFVDSKELHEAMKRAGVVGTPTIWFASQV